MKILGSTYAERWLVVDAIVRNHNVKGITFTCNPRRPIVEVPAVGDRVRWEFMQMPGESEEKLKRDDTVRAFVKKAGIDVFEIERNAVYAFHARVAERWRVGRVFLAGDATHLMPPFAGQGMNGGMKDAVNLSWKLVAVLRGQASEDILDTYEVECARRPRSLAPARLAHHADQPDPCRRSRLALRLPQSIEPLRRLHRAWGHHPSARHPSQRLDGGREGRADRPMAPQPTVRTAQGEAQLDRASSPRG